MNRQQLFSVGALAGATLLLETTLTRLLAVAQYYHFAFLVVSLALLGFGASGSLLSLSPRVYRGSGGIGGPEQAGGRLLGFAGLAFAASAGLAYGVVNLLPFDSYSIAWDPRQIFYFGLYYLALTAPFLFAGIGIGGALAAGAGRSHLVYSANLLGSGVGVLLAPLALWATGVPGAVLVSALVGLLAAYSSGRAWRTPARIGFGLALLAGAAGFTALGAANLGERAPLGMTISQYKGLANARRYPGSETIFGRWNAISRVDVLAKAGTRLLPGLSYTYPGTPPPQHGLSIDADAIQPVSLVGPERFEASGFLPEAVAFSLRPGGRVMVLEPGGGLGVLQAVAGGSREVFAVVANPLIPQAVSRVAGEADPYSLPGVWTVLEPPRVFLQASKDTYDLVYLPLTDAYRPVTSGAYSLSETYLLTEEAFTDMLAHLSPNGLLVVSRWLQTPPSEEVRLVATLVEALQRRSLARPEQAIVAYRGIQVLTALVQPDGWSAAELAEVRAFLEERRFDLVWAPDVQPEETNRFNRLPEPVYYDAVASLFGPAGTGTFYAAYPFEVAPSTDDRPFFFHFFRWGQTPELLATLGRTWQPFGGSGYLVLVALLVLVTVLSAGLILAPLLTCRPHGADGDLPGRGAPSRVRVLVYFTALGLAFLFVEIPLIQRWILLLGHPTYAFTVVVLVLLSFSSLGSALARSAWLPRRAAFAALVLLALLTPWIAAKLTSAGLAWPTPLRVMGAGLSLAPLAVLMGLPFPLGLAWLENQAPGWVPWAWAVNGCASVISAVLAAMLALSYGFTLVLLLGAAAYGVAFAALIGERNETDSGVAAVSES
ncbi:MAG TPA: hypothetical protein VGA03_05925 [Anaerolineales bacterium]